MADDEPAKPEEAEATPEVDPVAEHPVASKLRRAIDAHPVLRDEKKLVIGVEQGHARLSGSVFTISMFRQLAELVEQVAGGDDVIFDTEPQIKPPEDRALEGRVPGVSDGPSPSHSDFSVDHLPRRG